MDEKRILHDSHVINHRIDKSHERIAVEIRAVQSSLWMAIHTASDAGLGHLIDPLMVLHLDVARRLGEAEGAI